MTQETDMTSALPETVRDELKSHIPSRRLGTPEDIAGAVLYLMRDAGYVTGQILAVDGGRSIGW